nr:MAG TPA: hypothetical protein [Siphoviridae sp. ctELO16]
MTQSCPIWYNIYSVVERRRSIQALEGRWLTMNETNLTLLLLVVLVLLIKK